MGVLFMMPGWEDASEAWMQRMMQCIASDLVAIAVNHSRDRRIWGNRVPAISLQPTSSEIPLFSRAFGYLGLALGTNPPSADRILQDTVHRWPVTHILCQYGTLAAEFAAVWDKIDLPIYVHFHGYDATFDLRRSEAPDRRRFSDNYLHTIKALESRAIFITSSQFTKSLLVQAGISPDRVKVKYCGVPLADRPHNHEKRSGVQILHLGRLVDFKSPDRTIQAFELARSRGLDAHLTIAGDGPLRVTCELLRKRSSCPDRIRILGAVNSEKAEHLFSDADIFTQHNVVGELTGQAEGLGVSILEAMAAGVPVVGTRSGGVLETVVDGETGILVEPGDIDAQASAFLRLAEQPELRQAFGRAGRDRVAAQFSPELESRRLREIMQLAPLPLH
jgi:glycosyltransferase involved in cell wall biosynthesis